MPANPLYKLLCLFDHHTRVPETDLWHDGWRYRSVCRGCGRPLARTKLRWMRQDHL